MNQYETVGNSLLQMPVSLLYLLRNKIVLKLAIKMLINTKWLHNKIKPDEPVPNCCKFFVSDVSFLALPIKKLKCFKGELKTKNLNYFMRYKHLKLSIYEFKVRFMTSLAFFDNRA